MTGILEGIGGLGNALGPVIGAILFQIGGFSLPFIFLSFVYSVLLILEYKFLDETVETMMEVKFNVDPTITVGRVISNWRILIYFISAFIAIFQMVFSDPFLPVYLTDKYGLLEFQIGIAFFLYTFGYFLMSIFISYINRILSYDRIVLLGMIMTGLFTTLYGPFIKNENSTCWITFIALFFAGAFNASIFIPLYSLMLEESYSSISDAPGDKDYLNDLNSGIFSIGVETGELIGPIVGNYGFINLGAPKICLIVGLGLIGFGGVFFVGTYSPISPAKQ